MKKLWSVCIVLALVASAAFASYKKEDLKAQMTSGGEQISIEKLVARYEMGEPMSELEKAMLEDYFAANAGRDESNPMDGVGGPDAFGYRWVDNQGGDTATFNWIEISTTGTLAPASTQNADDASAPVPLSFSFPMYGNSYTQVSPSSDGTLAMGAVTTTSVPFSNTCTLPTVNAAWPNGAAIFPYWDDQHSGRGGRGTFATVSDSGGIYYQDFGSYFVVQWDSIGRFSPSFQHTYTYQAILYPDGKIKIQVLANDIWPTSTTTPSPTVAIQGVGAGNALTYFCSTVATPTATMPGRAIWFYPPTVAPVGACCYLSGGHGVCADLTGTDCSALGGQWAGAGTSCATNPCPVGRCCYNGGAACADVIQLECTALGGTWTSGMSCAANPCPVAMQGSDLCADAPAATIGATYLGTTVGATAETGIPVCGDGYNTTALGVWYKVTGTGNTMTASLCDLVSFDTELFIFCGSCDALTCVEGNDDFCGLGSQQAWCSTFGTTYYVLVTAFGSGSGAYTFRVSDDGVPCTGAVNCSPFGRCCYADALGPQCADVTAEECLILGGEFDVLSTCAAGSCGGSCCYLVDNAGFCNDEAVCVENVLRSACTTLSGTWYQGLTCAETPCQAFVPCVCNCSLYPNSHSTLAADETTYPIISFNPPTCVTVNVPIEYQITDLNVCIDLIHTYDGDISISITSPMGTTVVLSANNGSFGDNYLCTEFDDEALNPIGGGAAPFSGSWIPDNALSAFDGENAVGNWLVCVDDQVGGDDGFIIGTCLKFEYDQILPVAFGSFDAVAGDRSITLNWNTSSESHLDRYEIIRDGATIANVSAQNSGTGANYTYTDENLTNGTVYSYSLVVVDVNGTRATLSTLSATPSAAATVTEYSLHQNYPNPFNPTTNIVFDMVEAGHVTVSVFNIMGQKVAELVNGNVEAGRHTVNFDATGLSSGLYLYKMEANGFTAQSKMILMK